MIRQDEIPEILKNYKVYKINIDYVSTIYTRNIFPEFCKYIVMMYVSNIDSKIAFIKMPKENKLKISLTQQDLETISMYSTPSTIDPKILQYINYKFIKISSNVYTQLQIRGIQFFRKVILVHRYEDIVRYVLSATGLYNSSNTAIQIPLSTLQQTIHTVPKLLSLLTQEGLCLQEQDVTKYKILIESLKDLPATIDTFTSSSELLSLFTLINDPSNFERHLHTPRRYSRYLEDIQQFFYTSSRSKNREILGKYHIP